MPTIVNHQQSTKPIQAADVKTARQVAEFFHMKDCLRTRQLIEVIELAQEQPELLDRRRDGNTLYQAYVGGDKAKAASLQRNLQRAVNDCWINGGQGAWFAIFHIELDKVPRAMDFIQDICGELSKRT